MKKWIDELQEQPWSRAKKANDQPAFNWALNKTVGQVDMQFMLLIQFSFLYQITTSLDAIVCAIANSGTYNFIDPFILPFDSFLNQEVM